MGWEVHHHGAVVNCVDVPSRDPHVLHAENFFRNITDLDDLSNSSFFGCVKSNLAIWITCTNIKLIVQQSSLRFACAITRDCMFPCRADYIIPALARVTVSGHLTLLYSVHLPRCFSIVVGLTRDNSRASVLGCPYHARFLKPVTHTLSGHVVAARACRDVPAIR